MRHEPAREDQPIAIRTTRMEAFSDGVFAIAITLLVLEIGVPEGNEDRLLRAIVEQWPSYLAYLVSFSTIGAAWLAHSVITEFLAGADARLMRLNLLLLMVVSFLPFPTRLFADSLDDERAERVAATFYGVTLLLTAVLVSVLWRHAVRARLLRPDVPRQIVDRLTERFAPSMIGYVVMIALALFFPLVAVIGYLLIAVLNILPFALRRRRD